jgi:serine/threonine protein kinase
MEIFMELQDESLKTLLASRTDSASLQPLAYAVAVQILSALEHLHTILEPGMYHRDIKPGNILYTTVNGQNVFRLSDFGLSKLSIRATNSDVGTNFYMAPEVGTAEDHTEKLDIYSLYMTLVNILDFNGCRTRAHMFSWTRDLVREIAMGAADSVLRQYKKMAHPNPSTRASAADMLKELQPRVYIASSPAGEVAAPDDARKSQAQRQVGSLAQIEEMAHSNESDAEKSGEGTGNYNSTERENDTLNDNFIVESPPRPQKRPRETIKEDKNVKNAKRAKKTKNNNNAVSTRTRAKSTQPRHAEEVEPFNADEMSESFHNFSIN